jgi:hypothetical protein
LPEGVTQLSLAEQFSLRIARMERLIMNITLSLLALLIACQALLTIPAVRRLLSLVERLEGVPLD